MSAKLRDIIKTRPQRIGEVFTWVHEKTGMANSNMVAFGGNLAPHSTPAQLAVSDTCAVIGGVLVDKAAQTAIVVPSAANTSSGQECVVLVELDAAGTVTLTAGAVASTGFAVRPAETPSRTVLGTIKVPASYVAGTTSLAGAVITKEVYFGA